IRISGDGRPGSVRVASVVIVANDESIFLFLKRPLLLLQDEIFGKAWTVNQLLAADVANEYVAGDVADHRQMIVINRKGRGWDSRWQTAVRNIPRGDKEGGKFAVPFSAIPPAAPAP